MAVVKFLFYLTVYSLIKIGDGATILLNSLISLLKKISHQTNLSAANTIARSRTLYRGFASKLRKRASVLLTFNLKFGRPSLFRSQPQPKKKKRNKAASPVVRTSSLGFATKIRYFSFGALLSFLFVFLPIVGYLFMTDLPTLDGLSVASIPKTTKIYDRNGELLYEFFANQNRTIIPLSDVPPSVREATIAIEDQDFYTHPGFDIRGILRASVVNITEGELQGGSTITQQLIKSALLTPEPTVIRKSKELVLALLAEQRYTKDEILELYFNYVPYGGTAWGIQAASEAYFGKNIQDVSLAEAAFLAGLPKAPSQYSPYLNDNNAWKKRQGDVLAAMVRDGYITSDESAKAYSKPLVFQSPKTSIKAPHFVMYVKEELVKRYGLYEVERGGLHVVTSLDLSLQQVVEEETRQTVDESQHLGIGNAASLVTDPRNGDILAMVGSRNFFDTEHDGNVNVTTALRQPGSTIKLVTYAAALSNGFSEGSILEDTPITIKIPGSEDYRPVNYDGKYHGATPLRIALANSYNIPAVRLAEKLGPETVAEFGRKMGISSWGADRSYGLSITLGGNEVTMVDLASAYGTVANGGSYVPLDPILSVSDSAGRSIEEKNAKGKQVLSEGVAFILSDILSDNTARSRAFGVNSPLHIPGHRVSVKTGTTDNKRDNWTVGFTDNYVVATWVGNNDNTPLSPTLASGITGAAPLWRTVMEKLVSSTPAPETLSPPPTIVSRRCFGYDAYFIRGTEGYSGGCRMLRPSPTLTRD